VESFADGCEINIDTDDGGGGPGSLSPRVFSSGHEHLACGQQSQREPRIVCRCDPSSEKNKRGIPGWMCLRAKQYGAYLRSCL